MHQAFLLTRGWQDRGGALHLEYWASTSEGPLRLHYPNETAVFFVERGVDTRAGRRRQVALRSLGGREVDAVYFARQRDLRAERERLIDRGHPPLEADLAPSERFLMERFVTGSCALDGDPATRRGYRELTAPVMKPGDYRPSLRVAAVDIETRDLSGPVLSIALFSEGSGRVLMIGEGQPPDDTRFVPDEAALLGAFVDELRALDPDVILGWNVVEFDLACLLRRAADLGVRLGLGRDGSEAQVLPPRRRNQPPIARVAGRVVLDGIAALRSATYDFESFALDDVARELLGRGKLIESVEDRVDEIRRLFEQDKPKLAAYNLEDCRLVVDIFERTNLIDFLVVRQQLTGLAMDRQGGAVAAFDHLYLPRLHREGCVAPSVGHGEEAQASPGGYVLESVPGLYDNVVVLDFKSLYPSIIRTFCIDPLGLAFPGEDSLEGFEGARFSRTRHILPGLIERLWKARDEAKRHGDEARSRAIKILMNSFYGVLGTPGCRFFSPRLASSITRRGHSIILQSRDFIEARGFRVIYGDTDSLFVHLGQGLDEQRCSELGAELAAVLNTFWAEKLASEFAIDSRLEVEFEAHYLRFLMPTTRGSDRGSKKRYAGLACKGGRPTMVFRGLEAVRTDWTPLAREFQRELYRRVFVGEPYEDYVRKVREQLLAGELDGKLVYRKRLRRDLEDYRGGEPPHVKAARQLERPGRYVEYIITLRGPEPRSALTSPIDHRHYLERQLVPVADAILRLCGTDFARIAGEQLTLF